MDIAKLETHVLTLNEEQTISLLQTLTQSLGGSFDPGFDDNWLFRRAAQNGYAKLVDLLLESSKTDKRIDPGSVNSIAIRVAAKNGRVEVVKLLLKQATKDKRIDPGALNNQAIRLAADGGHTEVMKLLLEAAKTDERIDPGTNYNEAIRAAAFEGHTEIVKLLLEAAKTDKRVNPGALNSEAFCKAYARGHTEIVALLDPWKPISQTNATKERLVNKPEEKDNPKEENKEENTEEANLKGGESCISGPPNVTEEKMAKVPREVRTYGGKDLRLDEEHKKTLDGFPKKLEGGFAQAYAVFRTLVQAIRAEQPLTLTLPEDAPVRISRINDYHETICVTHKPSGYGWGWYYSSTAVGVKILDQSMQIVEAYYVWVVINSGDDYMTCDPKCVRSFETETAARAWKKPGGDIYKFRHYTD